MTHTITETVDLTMPDNSVITVDLKFTVTYAKNPCDKEPSQYHGEDDGWVVEEVEVAD